MGWREHRDYSSFHCLLIAGKKIPQNRGHMPWALMHQVGLYRQARMGKAFQAEGLASTREQCYMRSIFRKSSSKSSISLGKLLLSLTGFHLLVSGSQLRTELFKFLWSSSGVLYPCCTCSQYYSTPSEARDSVTFCRISFIKGTLHWINLKVEKHQLWNI